MPTKPDYLGKSVKKIIAPFLLANGFRPRSVKAYYRVRDHFVDVVLFSRSAWGSGFYMHYFTNPLATPLTKVLSSYQVGNRLSADADHAQWEAGDQQESDRSVSHALQRLEEEALPWFDELTGPEAYLTRLEDFQQNVYRARTLVCLCLLGKTKDALALCDERRSFLETSELAEEDVTKAFLQYYDDLCDAIRGNRLEGFLRGIEEANMKDAKIATS